MEVVVGLEAVMVGVSEAAPVQVVDLVVVEVSEGGTVVVLAAA